MDQTIWQETQQQTHTELLRLDRNVRRTYAESGITTKVLRMGDEWAVFRTRYSDDLGGLYCKRMLTNVWLVWVCNTDGAVMEQNTGPSLGWLLRSMRKAAKVR